MKLIGCSVRDLCDNCLRQKEERQTKDKDGTFSSEPRRMNGRQEDGERGSQKSGKKVQSHPRDDANKTMDPTVMLPHQRRDQQQQGREGGEQSPPVSCVSLGG